MAKKDVSQSGARMFLLEWSLCWIFKRETSLGGGGVAGGGEGEGKERRTPLSYGMRFLLSPIFLRDKIKDGASHFFVYFFFVTARLRRENALKMPNFSFYGTVNKRSFLNLSPVPRNQLQGNSPTFHICDAFAFAVVDAKAPYHGEYPSGDQFKPMFKLARLTKSHVNKAVGN